MGTGIPKGEFALIEQLLLRRPLSSGRGEVIGPGDDASILRVGSELLALSVDSFVEQRHFDFSFCSPYDAGIRSVEATCSDIVAVGGLPYWLWISLGVSPSWASERVLELYDGIYAACKRVGATVQGGETVAVEGPLHLSLTGMGIVADESHICARHSAVAGDAVCVSGPLGGSAAGLRILQQGLDGWDALKCNFLQPACRTDIITGLAPHAHAMIDISDGLSSELWHIAEASGVGLRIEAERIPLSDEVRTYCAETGSDPLRLALHGGEDFELLYTLPPHAVDSTRDTVIGSVAADRGVMLISAGQAQPLPAGGFNHFE